MVEILTNQGWENFDEEIDECQCVFIILRLSCLLHTHPALLVIATYL